MRRIRRFYWKRVRRYRYEMCRCGRPVGVVWSADNALFNEVNGSPNGIWCIPCFDRLCETRSMFLRWVPERL